MNFLAHIYLSGEDEGITIGNFIADGIKGKKYKKFPPKIQKGILLHRENYSHYSGVIVDILYDHFLAKNWNQYHELPLDEYVENFYDLLRNNFTILPTRIQRMMPYMITDNWLLNYATVRGISTILDQMNVRTKGKSKMNFAVLELEQYYTEFETEFTSFFDELIIFSEEKLKEL